MQREYFRSSDKSPLMHSTTTFNVWLMWHDCSSSLGWDGSADMAGRGEV
jgi:hypothetical protein